jgi:hypothetical protein
MTESDKAVWAGVGVDVGRKLDASKASMALSSVCIRVRIVGGRSVGWWWSVEVGQTFHHLFRCSLLAAGRSGGLGTDDRIGRLEESTYLTLLGSPPSPDSLQERNTKVHLGVCIGMAPSIHHFVVQ